MDKTTLAIIGNIKKEQQILLESLVDFAKADPFEHGIQVGYYNGLRKALELIDVVLEDKMEEDSRL